MCMQVRFHADLDDPIFAFNLINEPRHTVFATTSEWSDGPSGHFAAGRDGHGPRRLRQLARADALHDHPVGRARRAWARTRSTCARTSPRSSSTAARVTGGIADVPHEFSLERA